jgi:tetratricopeptide (TPR) repeat protein
VKRVAALLFALGSVFSPARRLAKRGVEEFRAKRFPDAQRDFRAASRRDPAEKTWNFNLGTADAAAGKSAEARAELSRAAESSDPAISGKALYQLGTLDLQAQNYSDAAKELRRSLELAPGNPEAKRNFEIAMRSQKKPPPPKPGDGKENENQSPGRKPDRGLDDSEFRRKAGMTRAEAEAMLRSLENEQKQKERVSAREEGKDW